MTCVTKALFYSQDNKILGNWAGNSRTLENLITSLVIDVKVRKYRRDFDNDREE